MRISKKAHDEFMKRLENPESKAKILDNLVLALIESLHKEIEAIAQEEAEHAIDNLQITS